MTDDDEVFEMEVNDEPGEEEELEEVEEKTARKKKTTKTAQGKGGKKKAGTRKKRPGKKKRPRPSGGGLKRVFDMSTPKGKVAVAAAVVIVALVIFAAYGRMTGEGPFGGDSDDEAPPNQAPSAVFVMDPLTGAQVDEVVYLDARGSRDPDGALDEEAFSWDIDASDGVDFESPDLQGKIVEWTYEETGQYTITLRVEDNKGATSEASKTLNVTQMPADVSMTSTHTSLPVLPDTFTVSINTVSAGGDAGIANFSYRITQSGVTNETIDEGEVSSLGPTTSPVSFWDTDGDEKFSTGDSFIIQIENLDPQPQTGDLFILVYNPAPDKTSEVTLS